MLKKIGVYRKALVSLGSGLLAWGGTVVASAPAHVTSTEWLAFGGVWFAAFMVAVSAPNDTPTPAVPPAPPTA